MLDIWNKTEPKFKSTVSDIVANLQQTVDKLFAHALAHDDAIAAHEAEISRRTAKMIESTTEKDQAMRIANKLKELLS